MTHKYTIIGWGLAGSSLAWHFHINRIPIRVYDNGLNHSSRVAAGMINPIIFKRLTKGWKVDQLMPYAETFYSEIEEKLSVNLLSRRKIVRVFSSVEEQNNWASLEGDGRYTDYLNPAEDLEHSHVDAPFGVGKVNSLGHLDINKYLNLSKNYMKNHLVEFIDQPFDDKQVQEDEQYIFCEGYHVQHNSHFGYIPMKPVHGDVLMILAPDLKYDDILNKNMFVLPLGNDLYRVGSTYNWSQNTPEPLEEGRLDLEDRLRSFCSFDFEVISHEAGIRPAVADRRPVLGTHPTQANIHIFNGLGTKGVSIAPLFAQQMVNYLLKGEKIESEVDVSRFSKHFNP